MDINDITYERKHNESYMVIEGKLMPDSYETRMIKENKIKSLLDMTTISIDGQSKISYKISRKENLEDFVEASDLTKENLTRLIINIKIALDEISNYLIDESHILLTKETVFFEKGNDSYQVSLCYLPFGSDSIQNQFRILMDFFISKLTIKDREASKSIYEAYDLCLKDDYTLDEVIECLQAGESHEIHVEKVSFEEENDEIKDFEESYEELSIDENYISDFYNDSNEKESIISKLLGKTKGFISKMNFEDEKPKTKKDDFIIEPDYELEEKTVLLTDTKPVGRLIYDGVNNEDDFIITKDIFRIGSAKNNDAVLKAKTVSGNHAKITKTGNDFFLSDVNSTNGSFLNNLPLAYHKAYKLKPMDKIKFAGEAFIFY